MHITFRDFTEGDIEPLTPIMTRSFDNDSLRHAGVTGGPPGYDDGSFLRTWGLHEDSTAFCIEIDHQIAGGVILWIRENGENFLGCIFLDPRYIGRGIGTRVWKMVEERYPETVAWSTETLFRSTGNLVFYINKCGFSLVRIDFTETDPEGCARFRKVMQPA